MEKEENAGNVGQTGQSGTVAGISSVKGVLEGSWFVGMLRQNLLYVIFVTCIAIYCIYNGYATEKMHRERQALEKEVKDLRFESISVGAELMVMRKQSEVLKRVREEGLALEESKVPPVKLYRR